MSEFDEKQARLQTLLKERRLDALLLRRVSNVAWATCGARAYVNIASDIASAALLISRSSRHLITNNLEAARFDQEEHLARQGWEFHVAPWYEERDEIAHLTRGLRVGADCPYPGALDLTRDLTRMRTHLTPEEAERFRLLGALCVQAVDVTARSLAPGQTEQDISARLGFEAELRGVQAITNIVATDWRIETFRHALPTDKPLERYAMLVLNGRRWGLVCTVTRFIHFGPLPAGVREHHALAAQIAAECIHATRPGASLADLFQVAVSMGQAYIWNPSIGSARSVDPFLVGPADNEILTELDSWPALAVRVKDRVYQRPAVLERD